MSTQRRAERPEIDSTYLRIARTPASSMMPCVRISALRKYCYWRAWDWGSVSTTISTRSPNLRTQTRYEVYYDSLILLAGHEKLIAQGDLDMIMLASRRWRMWCITQIPLDIAVHGHPSVLPDLIETEVAWLLALIGWMGKRHAKDAIVVDALVVRRRWGSGDEEGTWWKRRHIYPQTGCTGYI